MAVAPVTNHLKIVKKDDTVHIIPDNKTNREFHSRYTTQAPPADKYKSLSIVKGQYSTNKTDGSTEFKETELVEHLFENHTPEDSRAAALTAQNESLQEQIEELQKKLRESEAGDAQ